MTEPPPDAPPEARSPTGRPAGRSTGRPTDLPPEAPTDAPPEAPTDARIAAALMDLAQARAPRTFCPSEAARALAADWRPLMPAIRRVAATLPLAATQGGAPVDPITVRGPIRLAAR